VQDRDSRFVVASSTGPVGQDLITQAVKMTAQRTHHRPLAWYSDGWQGYADILTHTYRQPQPRHGRTGRRKLVVPETISLMQNVKHRDSRGRLLSVEIRMAMGQSAGPAGTVHVERLNGALRDRVNALTRKTHAFAKRDATWDALLGLQIFDHNFHRSHLALRLPLCVPDSVHRYQHRSPAMALGITDHLWSFQDLLTARLPITP
jgi:hypothetical protein